MKIIAFFAAVCRCSLIVLFGLFSVCGSLCAEEIANDYVLNVSAVGLAGNYELFFEEFCKLSDKEIYEYELVAEKCKASGFFDPMANIEVFLKNTSGEIVQTQTTDSQGKCTFRGIPLEKYYVEIITKRPSVLTGATEKITYRNSNFNPYIGLYTDEISFQGCFFVAEMQGRVVDSSGKGVKGIKMMINVSNLLMPTLQIYPIELTATTDDSGKYKIPMIIENANFLELRSLCQNLFSNKTTKYFSKLFQIEAMNGAERIGSSAPFFVITEELHHYFFLAFETSGDKWYWRGKKNLDPKRKYSNVPKSKGHVLMIPDIVLENSPQK